MSRDFIEKGYNKSSLSLAEIQKKQILEIAKSDIQEPVTYQRLESVLNKNFATNDDFSNYLKSVVKDKNFLSIYNFVRKPLPSASLINTDIRGSLMRVLYAEDSYHHCKVNGETYEKQDDLGRDIYSKKYFNDWLFRTNDIYITDEDDKGKAYSYLLDVEKVVSLSHNDFRITKIAFKGNIPNREETGTIYIDDDFYQFYDKDLNLIKSIKHEQEKCPASFIGTASLDNDFVVKESPFSYMRSDLETYNLLVTLQKMTDIKGGFPTVVKLGGSSESGSEQEETNDIFGNQSAKSTGDFEHTKSNPIDAMTVVEVPQEDIQEETAEGQRYNIDIVKNYLTYFYIPVEILKQIDDRVKSVKKGILDSLIGKHLSEDQEGSKTDTHLDEKSSMQEDKLRHISQELSLLRTRVEYAQLSLEHGAGNVEVEYFYGSKFFKDSVEKLLDMRAKCPNPIERKEISLKITKNRNRFNPKKGKRELILQHIIPYDDDKDFDDAVNFGVVDDYEFLFYKKFYHWVNKFEAAHGDILTFYENLKTDDGKKIDLISKMMLNIIKENHEEHIRSIKSREVEGQK